jgi:hypothetical protein
VGADPALDERRLDRSHLAGERCRLDFETGASGTLACRIVQAPCAR